MSAEVVRSEIPATNEAINTEQKGSCVFFSGANSTYVGLGAVDGTLKKHFGKENVSVHNSVLFAEIPAENRYQVLSKDLKKKLEKGPVSVIAHSFGAAELAATISTLAVEDPEFFTQDKLDNLSITLISPAMPKNTREGLWALWRFSKIAVQEAAGTPLMEGTTWPGKHRKLRGISATNIIPPEGVDFATVKEEAAKFSRHMSHSKFSPSIPIVDFDTPRNYKSVLSAEDTKTFQDASSEFAHNIEHRSTKAAKKAHVRYGRKMTKILPVLDKTDFSSLGDTQMKATNHEWTRGAKRRRRKLFSQAFFTGDVYKQMINFAECGAKVQVVIPEYDLMTSAKQVRRLHMMDNVDVVIAKHTTHAFPWAQQPEWLLDLLNHQKIKPGEPKNTYDLAA